MQRREWPKLRSPPLLPVPLLLPMQALLRPLLLRLLLQDHHQGVVPTDLLKAEIPSHSSFGVLIGSPSSSPNTA